MAIKIDENTVDKISQLARLEFSKEAKPEILNDMNKLLEFVSKLDELDTEGVEPLTHISEEENVFREDIVKDELTQQEALKNAPSKDAFYFRVPKVVGNDEE